LIYCVFFIYVNFLGDIYSYTKINTLLPLFKANPKPLIVKGNKHQDKEVVKKNSQ